MYIYTNTCCYGDLMKVAGSHWNNVCIVWISLASVNRRVNQVRLTSAFRTV